MDYRVLIFMAKDRLAAIDVDGDDVPDTVSLDGNNVMVYTTREQIKAFCEYVKEYYNIEQYSDLRMEISVLRFDAAMEDAFVLFNLLQEGGAEACNLASVEKLLPWVAMKEGLLKAGTAVQIKTFDLLYTVTLGKDMVLQCSPGKDGEGHPFDFPKEKFAEYFHLGKKNLLDYEEEKREWQKKLDDALQEKGKRIGELEKQLQTEQAKVKKAEDNLAESQRALREKLSNANRQVCYLKCADKEKDKEYIGGVYKNPFGSLYSSSGFKFSYRHCLGTGVAVAKGTEIAIGIVKVQTNDPMHMGMFFGRGIIQLDEFSIKAETAGRLFWLSEEVPKEIAYGDAIAVIGNESDTKADIMKWYKENT